MVTVVGGGFAGRRLGLWHGEKLTAAGELLFSPAIAEEAVVADALETVGKDVEEEAADELVGGQRYGLRPVAVAVVLPAETDLAVVVDADQAIVGDGDAVGVAGDIGQHLFGSGEGRLGIDHPFGLSRTAEVAPEAAAIAERREGAEEAQFVGVEGLLQIFQE